MSRLKYLIPSFFTFLSIYFAFQAYLATSLGASCWCILKCVILDKVDGTAARILNASSRFGVKLDSIADAIAFGLMPGILIFQCSKLMHSPSFILFTQFCGIIYILGTFYRLYKFDKLARSGNAPENFVGIPSTLAAGIFAAYGVAFENSLGQTSPELSFVPILGLILALLMNGRFPTLKAGKPEKKSLLYLQILFFSFITVAVFLELWPKVLFVLSLMVLVFTIVYGSKKYKKITRPST